MADAERDGKCTYRPIFRDVRRKKGHFCTYRPTFRDVRCTKEANNTFKLAEVMEMSHFSGHLLHFRPFLMEMSLFLGHLHHFGL